MGYLFGERAEDMSSYLEYAEEDAKPVVKYDPTAPKTKVEPSYPEKAIMGLYDTFGFGKHRGKKLEGIIDTYPGYIAWLCKNNVVKFDEEVMTLIEEEGIYKWQN